MCAQRSAHVRMLLAVTIFTPCLLAQTPPQAQPFSDFERQRAIQMLGNVAADVKKHYYDPKFHGLDWDARIQQAKERIQKSTSQNAALSHIAGALDSLNDSHTFFLPPSRPYVHDYGFQYEMIGDRCFLTRVRPQSDAEAKGVKPGDEILAINGFAPARDNIWQVEYVFNVLRPLLALRLDLRNPAGVTRQVEVQAKFREVRHTKDLTGGDIWDLFREGETYRHQMRARVAEVGDDLMILKLPTFDFSQTQIEGMINRARKHATLVVDLRENGGGSVDTLKYLLSGVFDKEVKIGDRVRRNETKPEIDKIHFHNPFTGKLVVLVDSKSASASEIFARIVQIERRGVVMGDHSSGSVMEAVHYSYRAGMGITTFFGASITDADIVMTDGKSLEHVGVTPDETSTPTAQDLANGRDPVLAHAAQALGVQLAPEEAGKLFPYEWPNLD